MSNINVHLFHASKAASLLGVHTATLRNWEKKGQIKSVRSPSGHRLYDVTSYLNAIKASNPSTTGSDSNIITTSATTVPSRIAYCRVSSHKQQSDLERQCSYLTESDPTLFVIKDIASGINFKRPGLCCKNFLLSFMILK